MHERKTDDAWSLNEAGGGKSFMEEVKFKIDI